MAGQTYKAVPPYPAVTGDAVLQTLGISEDGDMWGCISLVITIVVVKFLNYLCLVFFFKEKR